MPGTLEKLVEKRKGGAVGIVRILPGGTFRAWVPGVYDPVVLFGTEMAFTDRNGSHWIRRWNGLLEELDDPPLKYLESFGLLSPYFMQMPERIT